MRIYQPFVYVIGWSKHDRWYIGCRYKAGTTPSDLWTKYFTSSKDVRAFRYVFGEPDVFRIFTVSTKEDALNRELALILYSNAVQSERFLNRCNNGKVWNLSPSQVTQRNAAVRKALTGTKKAPFTPEHRARISAAQVGREPWNKGVTLSDDYREKLSEAAKKPWSESERAARMSNPNMRGYKHTEETIAKLRLAAKKREETKRAKRTAAGQEPDAPS